MVNKGLEINDLRVRVGNKSILNDLSLKIKPGEMQALLGPNGSGKTTLAMTIAGRADCLVRRGQLRFNGKKLLPLQPDERSRRGIFVAWQQPAEIPGVSCGQYLRTILNAHRPSPLAVLESYRLISETMKAVGAPLAWLERGMNDGFSGGERKKMELIQLALLKPSLCVLDEIDAGLDMDAQKNLGRTIRSLRAPHRSWLIITHNQRWLKLLRPERVSVINHGRITASGGAEVLKKIERDGYAQE